MIRAYAPAVNIRKLLALVLAMAVMFAPAMTRAGAAFAAVPDHQMQMMESGHCKAAPSDSSGTPSDHDKKAAGGCCMSMCMAVAVAPAAPSDAATIHAASTTFAAPKRYHGCIAEIATPPPRLA